MDPVSAASSSSVAAVSNAQTMKYSTYLSRKEVASGPNTISGIMNGVIKEKLKIIPSNLTWQGISELVYNALVNDIMKPRIDEASEPSSTPTVKYLFILLLFC